jgi:hypothetical protein
VAPHRESGAGVKIVAVLAVFALALGGLVFWLSTKDTIEFGGGDSPRKPIAAPVTTTPGPPTTTSKPAPFAEAGDCVLMTGLMMNPDFRKVACDGGQNYTVTKVVTSPPPEEKCGAETDGYVQYKKLSMQESVSVCLIPFFTDGACYDLVYSMVQAALPKKECGSVGTAQVKVLANTVDKAACGPGAVLALAYPETEVTYCFSR